MTIPRSFILLSETENTKFRNPHWAYQGKVWLDLTGIVFSEEVRRREFRDGWVFFRRTGLPSTKATVPKATIVAESLIEAERCGRPDLSLRAPGLAFAKNKTCVVIGLGCVGAMFAL